MNELIIIIDMIFAIPFTMMPDLSRGEIREIKALIFTIFARTTKELFRSQLEVLSRDIFYYRHSHKKTLSLASHFQFDLCVKRCHKSSTFH